jgi:hypothetical protein
LTTAESLVPYLKTCGYGDMQIQRPFKVDHVTIPVVAFAGRPFDSWSACIAVVNWDGDSKTSAANVRALGASTVFVCSRKRVDWWAMGPGGPTTSRSIEWSHVGDVFREHKDELAPSRIYNAKLQRPSALSRQLWFFDVGLMPAIEKNRGQSLLRVVESAIASLQRELGAKLTTRQAQEDAYRTVFWLLAAKVLHDKNVENFIRIDLTNVDEVFDRIGRHHGETDRFPPFGREGRRAIDEIAATIARCGSLADVSSESIAYVYENALIDKAAGGKKAKKGGKPYDIRKELGIHSTPSVLIHHMLSQMWGMIEEIRPEDRNVFEPACGHAPFLTAGMRWLRDWGQGGPFTTTHEYLRSHLHGLEADGFAIELAKLALTLADEPYGNKWQLTPADMFLPGVLAKNMRKAHILLSNPPYEAFTLAQRARYARAGEAVTANTKATEMLMRTLPHVPPGGVFGVVLPLGVLHDRESKPVRELLLDKFELSEISIFADNLFEHGNHEVAVLMGRRKRPQTKPVPLHYRRVREKDMAAFKDRLVFSWEREVLPNRFAASEDADLRVRDLDDVWCYLANCPSLGSVATVRQGASLHTGKQATVENRDPGRRPVDAVPAIVTRYRKFGVWEIPSQTWLYNDRRDVLHWRGGTFLGSPQVLLNYASQAREAWRLKGFYDLAGHAVTNKYTTVRPNDDGPSALALWALMNSPVTNAFAHCGSLKRHTFDGLLKTMPIPKVTMEEWGIIEAAALAYFATANSSASKFMRSGNGGKVKQALLALDAEVLKLYDLPPRLERQLLDLFTGVERKGVGCEFRGYYPPGFTSYLPLHMVISDRFKQAAADATVDRFKPGESAYVRAALSAAASAIEEK